MLQTKVGMRDDCRVEKLGEADCRPCGAGQEVDPGNDEEARRRARIAERERQAQRVEDDCGNSEGEGKKWMMLL